MRQELRDDSGGSLAGSAVYVVVGDEADGAGAGGAGEDSLLLQGGNYSRGIRRNAEDDDIGLDRIKVDLHAWLSGYGLGENTGIGMVFVQAGGHVVESDESGGGEDACLTHPSAESLAVDAGLGDVLLGAYQHGTDGCAETLGEAEVDGVEAASEFGDRKVESGRGVEDSRAVQMHRQSGRTCAFPDFFPSQGVALLFRRPCCEYFRGR